jgi:T5orf172 domain
MQKYCQRRTLADLTDEEMLAELGVSVEQQKAATYTAREERIIAGFEDIQRFVDEHKRLPRHGEGLDIFERLYAVRLDRIREQEDCRQLLQGIDRQGLLDADMKHDQMATADDEALLAELGIAVSAHEDPDDIQSLRHVRSNAEKQAAEEIGSRTVCKDFENFKPIFQRVQKDLELGLREARTLKKPDDVEYDEIRLDEIKQGALFIVGGQKAYIASLGDEIRNTSDRRDAKLRVIYDNGTEADVLMRSFQRSLYRDTASRLITDASAGPLFADASNQKDTESGTIYVLRSLSNHPTISANRDLIHKIGVTGGKVEERVSNAKLDPTYLFADVEVVATYELYNINRTKLENLIHRFFTSARFDLEIPDRFGNPVKPREWYLVPISVIDEAVARIRDGSIVEFEFDPKSARLAAR